MKRLFCGIFILLFATLASLPLPASASQDHRQPLTWNVQQPPAVEFLNAVAFGNGRFVAVGSAVLFSADGTTWTKDEVKLSGEIRDITYGAGQFVAVGSGGMIMTSADGATWTNQTSGTKLALSGVAYGNGKFVAVGSGMTILHAGFRTGWPGEILTSADGITWVKASGDFASQMTNIGTVGLVSYVNGQFVADLGGGTLVSADGLNWTRRTSPDSSPLGRGTLTRQVTYGNGLFVAVGGAVGGADIRTSTDGVDWIRAHAEITAALQAVAYGNGQFVAVGTHYVFGDNRGVIVTAAGEPKPMGPACGAFADLPQADPVCAAILSLGQRNVLAGYPDGTFRPDNYVTRAEFAKMLVLALGRTPDPAGDVPFLDAKAHWAATQGYLQVAIALGAIQGFGNGPFHGTFRPDDIVTRAEVVKMASAAVGLTAEGIPPYTDVHAQDWFSGWVATARKERLIGPLAPWPLWNGAEFAGSIGATRAEAAMILANLGTPQR